VECSKSINSGRPSRAAKTLGRFTINTLTTLGFADPARRLGLPTEEESFGVTLGYYGVASGPYVMLPFLDLALSVMVLV
jgi:phospholipid-binding lipoprotein MlaA